MSIYRITHPNSEISIDLSESFFKKRFGFSTTVVEVRDEEKCEWYIECVPTFFSVIAQELGQISPFFQCEETQDVSWEEQSKLHSPYWKHETKLIHIPLKNRGELLIKSGNGVFGDLSHVTTHLILEYLPQFAMGKNIVDIGHGNGVLSLAAKLYGAEEVFGLEIDQQAIALAEYNRDINGIKRESLLFFNVNSDKEISSFLRDIETCHKIDLMMNMTLGDIKTVLLSFSRLFSAASELLISGLLISQEEEFMKLIESYGFEYNEKIESDPWLFLSLKKRP